MSTNLAQAYTEIYWILKYMDQYYVNKIPTEFIQHIYLQKDDEYIPDIDMSIPLEKQKLLEETVNMLAIFKYNYWCENDEQKQELLDILNENEIKYQVELREKYNPDNIFKKPEIEEQEEIEETSLVEYKESLFKRIMNKIKNILKLNRNP